MQAVGSVLHLSHAEPAGHDSQGRSIVRHYLDRFELADPENPVRLAKVNIPGAFVSASADGRYLYTVDTQYEALADGNYQYSSRLCSLAKPGQTLVSEVTAAKLGGGFELRELPAEQVKGKAQPIRVFELLGRDGRG